MSADEAMTQGGDGADRLFFAALPGPETRAQLASAAEVLTLGVGARRVGCEDYHSTLAFVGVIPAASVSVLHALGDAQRGDAFTLRFDAYEYWPKPEVVVAAARVIPPALEQLWHRLHVGLAVHRWALEPKRLRPHITLARRVAQPPALPVMSAFEWTVTEFSLMRSERGGAHPAYTVVDTWPLLDDSAKTWKNSLI